MIFRVLSKLKSAKQAQRLICELDVIEPLFDAAYLLVTLSTSVAHDMKCP